VSAGVHPLLYPHTEHGCACGVAAGPGKNAWTRCASSGVTLPARPPARPPAALRALRISPAATQSGDPSGLRLERAPVHGQDPRGSDRAQCVSDNVRSRHFCADCGGASPGLSPRLYPVLADLLSWWAAWRWATCKLSALTRGRVGGRASTAGWRAFAWSSASTMTSSRCCSRNVHASIRPSRGAPLRQRTARAAPPRASRAAFCWTRAPCGSWRRPRSSWTPALPSASCGARPCSRAPVGTQQGGRGARRATTTTTRTTRVRALPTTRVLIFQPPASSSARGGSRSYPAAGGPQDYRRGADAATAPAGGRACTGGGVWHRRQGASGGCGRQGARARSVRQFGGKDVAYSIWSSQARRGQRRRRAAAAVDGGRGGLGSRHTLAALHPLPAPAAGRALARTGRTARPGRVVRAGCVVPLRRAPPRCQHRSGRRTVGGARLSADVRAAVLGRVRLARRAV
jgi:hypothetical protein